MTERFTVVGDLDEYEGEVGAGAFVLGAFFLEGFGCAL